MRAKRSDLKAWGFSLIPAAKRKGGKKPPTLPQGGALNQTLFTRLCKAHGLPVPDYEYRFAPPRRWRFDAIFDGWLAVEQCGGIWTGGHHSGGKDQVDDMERRNEAQILGFVVLEFTPQQFQDGSAFAVIKRALGSLEEQP